MRKIKKYESLVNWQAYEESMNALNRKFECGLLIPYEYMKAVNDLFENGYKSLWDQYCRGLLTEEERSYLENRLLDAHTLSVRKAAINRIKA